MPLMGSRGGASCIGLGLFLKPRFVPGGTAGIFASFSTINTYRYNFSNDGVTAYTNLTLAPVNTQAGAANKFVGIMALSSTNPNTRTNKLTFSNNSIVLGTALASPTQFGTATGNATLGLFIIQTPVNGSPSAATVVFNYASDTSAGGGSLLAVPGAYPATVGTSTYAIVSAVPGNTKTTNKYMYASDAVSAGTSFLTNQNSGGGACGNDTVGIFAYSLTSRKYIYSGETTAAGTAMITGSSGGAAGSSTFGIITNRGGANSPTNKYNYANDAVSSGSLFGVASVAGIAFANGVAGVSA